MIWNDIVHLLGAILVIVGAILPIVNPPGDASLFLRLTAGCDDATRNNLARRIAKKLEDDLQYPGQIEITVIREYRAKDFAR